MEVTVIGGGVIGLTVARELAAGGARVALVERTRLGSGSTWAAAGILSPTEPHDWAGALGAFNVDAAEHWPGWAAALDAEGDADSGFERLGEIRVGDSFDEPFLARAEAGAAAARWPVRRLTRPELAEIAPGARLAERAALHLPGVAAVHVDRLVAALTESCARHGVEVVEDQALPLTAKAPTTVRLVSGAVRSADRVVVAAGAWSQPLVADVGLEMPVVPLTGDAIVARLDAEPGVELVLRTEAGSIVPRADGSWWLGTSLRDADFDPVPELGSVAAIGTAATELVPLLRHARLLSIRCGPRPLSPDGMPFVGRVGAAGVASASESVVVAAGHGRQGIAHAPLCAHGIARGLLADDWSAIPPAFAPDRYV